MKHLFIIPVLLLSGCTYISVKKEGDFTVRYISTKNLVIKSVKVGDSSLQGLGADSASVAGKMVEGAVSALP